MTYLLNNQIKLEHRLGPQIVDLQVLSLIEPIFWAQGAEQAVRALVQRHRAVRVHTG